MFMRHFGHFGHGVGHLQNEQQHEIEPNHNNSLAPEAGNIDTDPDHESDGGEMITNEGDWGGDASDSDMIISAPGSESDGSDCGYASF
jgi:hypothetical protein